jgi:hypothetical protein
MTKKKEIERRKNVYIYKKLPDFLNALGISRDSNPYSSFQPCAIR